MFNEQRTIQFQKLTNWKVSFQDADILAQLLIQGMALLMMPSFIY